MRRAVAGGDCCGTCEFFLAPVGQENGACRRFPPTNRAESGIGYQPVDAELIACGEFRHWMDQVKPTVVYVRPATLRKVER
jgi:hypothetical protein